MTLTVNNPDSGSATEELAVGLFDADAAGNRLQRPLPARYHQPDHRLEDVKFTLADAGSPTLIIDTVRRQASLYVLDADARVSGAAGPGGRDGNDHSESYHISALKLAAFRNYSTQLSAGVRRRNTSC